MIVIKNRGNFNKTEKFLKRVPKNDYKRILEKNAEEGVAALASATPSDSGKTADSWGCEIKANREGYVIIWTNSNVNDGVPIAVILQYGHGTGTGGYVKGVDYINPALKPIYDKTIEEVWREVTSL